MDRTQADVAAGVLIASIVLLGIVGVAQLHLSGGPSGSEMDGTPLMAVIGPLIMTILVASVVGGVYVYVRSHVFTSPDNESATTGDPTDDEDAADVPESVSEETPDAHPSGPNIESVLEVLPDDERRILEPVVESPGLTQIKVRDRSDFSKSKVSQTITDLEERGLLYRESQGRTYRVYPADDLDDRL